MYVVLLLIWSSITSSPPYTVLCSHKNEHSILQLSLSTRRWYLLLEIYSMLQRGSSEKGCTHQKWLKVTPRLQPRSDIHHQLAAAWIVCI